VNKTLRRLRPWTWSRRLCAAGFLALLLVAARGGPPWIVGSPNGTELLGLVPFTDPLVALEVGLASRTWMGTVALGAGLTLGLALLLGPVFCGWLCPLGLLLDLAGAPRRALERWLPRRRLPELRFPREIKVGLLLGALAFSLVRRAPVFAALSPIQGVARVLLFGVEAALWVVAGLVLLELVAPRVWCRSLCPLGALYGAVGRRGLLRVRIDPERAGQIRCQRCELACPMGLRVMSDFSLRGAAFVDHPDCTRCGACTEICPNEVLRLGVREAGGRDG